MVGLFRKLPTVKATGLVFVIVCGGSAIVIGCMGLLLKGTADARSAFLSLYLQVALYTGLFAAIGFLPAYAILRWGASDFSKRRGLVWPTVSAAVSFAFLNLGVTSALVGTRVSRLFPPAHFGVTDLFVSVAIVSFVATLVLKVPDAWMRSSEAERSSQNA
jgi:hypothetical protein